MVHHAETLPSTQMEQIASAIVSQKAASVCRGSSGHQANLELSLATKGRKTSICLNPQIKKPVQFTTENMLQLQKYTGQSNSEMKKNSHFIRVYAGRKAVPSYIRKSITDAGKTLANIYHVTTLKMDVGQGKMEERPVFYGNASEIVEAVCEMRQINGPCLIKLLADSGKGSFKISLSIMPEDFEDNESHGQRTSYSEGGSVGNELSLNGVKRIILVAHVPDVKESWENCKALWDLAEINQISFLFVADIKLTRDHSTWSSNCKLNVSMSLLLHLIKRAKRLYWH